MLATIVLAFQAGTWSAELPEAQASTIRVLASRDRVLAFDGKHLHIFDRLSGKSVGSFDPPSDGMRAESLSAFTGRVYVVGADVYKADSGAHVRKLPGFQPVQAAGGGPVYFLEATRESRKVHRLDDDGNSLWAVDVKDLPDSSRLLVAADSVFVPGGGAVRKISGAGKVAWTVKRMPAPFCVELSGSAYVVSTSAADDRTTVRVVDAAGKEGEMIVPHTEGRIAAHGYGYWVFGRGKEVYAVLEGRLDRDVRSARALVTVSLTRRVETSRLRPADYRTTCFAGLAVQRDDGVVDMTTGKPVALQIGQGDFTSHDYVVDMNSGAGKAVIQSLGGGARREVDLAGAGLTVTVPRGRPNVCVLTGYDSSAARQTAVVGFLDYETGKSVAALRFEGGASESGAAWVVGDQIFALVHGPSPPARLVAMKFR